MKQYGLIGKSLSHSFSPKYFAKKFSREGIDASYKSIELEEMAELNEVLKQNISGLNVTIPYKESIIPY